MPCLYNVMVMAMFRLSSPNVFMGDMVLKINTIFPMKPSGMTTCLNDSIVDMWFHKKW